MDIKKFESRLNIDSLLYDQPTLDALNYYTKCFMLTVPFENIDVQNSVRISVEIEDIYDKIINHNRGGYCYEMNTLFQEYLKKKGFDTRISSATIHTPGGGRSQPGSHVSLLVLINGVFYVADVGFGDLPLKAVPITSESDEKVVNDVTGSFRAIFKNQNQNSFIIQKWENKMWNTKYDAELQPKKIHDFDENIEYNQNNPNSIFVKRLIVTIPTKYGRVSMSQNYLTITENQTKRKLDVTKSNYRLFLKRYFNIDIQINRLENVN